MPVTARLSKKFYDTLGEDVAQELVDWFNQVDATYRADLKELNELNFARFDAKLEQRITGVEARLTQEIRGLEARLDQIEGRLDGRIDDLDAKVARQISDLDTKLTQQMSDLETRLEQRMTAHFEHANAQMHEALASQRAELLKWTFLFVVGTAVAAIGVMTRLIA